MKEGKSLREAIDCHAQPEKRYWFTNQNSSTSVLCIHGRPGNSMLMRPFKVWCEKNSYGCYLYDQFSCGDDERFSGGSEDLLALLVEELWFHLGQLSGTHLVIVAHSFGAVLLCEALQRYDVAQERMKVILSGFCPVRDEFLAVNQRRLDDFAVGASNAVSEELFFDAHICNRDSMTLDQFVALKSKPLGDIVLRDSYLESLDNIRCPVLMTYGDDDICTDYQAAKITERLANCRSIKFSGAAHYPFIEQSHAYFKALDTFLA